MHSYNISSRPLEPTDTKPKRLVTDTENGTHTEHVWDHAYDAPELHENAARKVAEMENPGRPITLQRTRITSTGYTFRVLVGDGGV